ncbi:unnamed protein product, partial [Chrysoparadoxa australica]
MASEGSVDRGVLSTAPGAGSTGGGGLSAALASASSATSERSFRYNPFNGDGRNYHSWKTKTMSRARQLGFAKALTGNLSVPSMEVRARRLETGGQLTKEEQLAV